MSRLVLDCWRVKLNDSTATLKKACPDWSSACFYLDESHYAQEKGKQYLSKHLYNEAHHSFKRALRLADKAGLDDPSFLTKCHSGLASCFSKAGKHALAEQRWRRAIELAEQPALKDNSVVLHALMQSLSHSLQAMHRFIESIAMDREADAHCPTSDIQPTALQDWKIGDNPDYLPLLFQRG